MFQRRSGTDKCKKRNKLNQNSEDGDNYPPIRLTRAASARNMALLESHRQRKHTVDGLDKSDIIGSNDPPHPASPNAHALDLLRRVNSSVNVPFEPVGLSISDRLSSVRADPTVLLLQKTTWRDFFKHGGNSIASRPNSATSNGRRAVTPTHLSRRPYSRDSAPHSSPSDAIVSDPLSSIQPHSSSFKLTHSRPSHHHSTMTTPAPHPSASTILTTNEQFLRMKDRIEVLWHDLQIDTADRVFYRSSLLREPVQSWVHLREVARYIDMLNGHRKCTVEVLRGISIREEALVRVCDVIGAIRRQRARGGNSPSTSAPSISHHGLIPVNLMWREELIQALSDLQASSLHVIRLVQYWRRNLWRPRRFLYLGTDYFDRMVSEGEVLRQALAGMDIDQELNKCVVFQETEVEREAEIAGVDGDLSEEGLRERELKLAHRVVAQHSSLMALLEEETVQLIKARVFIPTLRLYPDLPERGVAENAGPFSGPETSDLGARQSGLRDDPPSQEQQQQQDTVEREYADDFDS